MYGDMGKKLRKKSDLVAQEGEKKRKKIVVGKDAA